jgi:hypothetical protein
MSSLRQLQTIAVLRGELERRNDPAASAGLARLERRSDLLATDLLTAFIARPDSGVSLVDLEWAWFMLPPNDAESARVRTARTEALGAPSANTTIPCLSLGATLLVTLNHARSIAPPPSLPPETIARHLLRRLDPTHFEVGPPLPSLVRHIHAALGKHSDATFRLLDLVARVEEAHLFFRLAELGAVLEARIATDADVARITELVTGELATRRQFEVPVQQAIFGAMTQWGGFAVRERAGIPVFDAVNVLRDGFLGPLSDVLERDDEFRATVTRVQAWRTAHGSEGWSPEWLDAVHLECFGAWIGDRLVDPLAASDVRTVGKTGLVASPSLFTRDYYLKWSEWGTKASMARAIRNVYCGAPSRPQIWHLGGRRWWVRAGDSPDGFAMLDALGRGERALEGRPHGWVRCASGAEAIAEWVARVKRDFGGRLEHGAALPPGL